MKACLVLIAGLAITTFETSVLDVFVAESSTQEPPPGAPVDIAPVLVFNEGDQIEVSLDFKNASHDPLRYVRSNTGGVYPLFFPLYKDDRLMQRRFTEEPPTAVKDGVRVLTPGERVLHRISLSDLYGALPVGRYTLKARYEVPKASYWAKELNVTAMFVDRVVLYLDIRDGEAAAGQK
jgi:hypothetical protein